MTTKCNMDLVPRNDIIGTTDKIRMLFINNIVTVTVLTNFDNYIMLI